MNVRMNSLETAVFLCAIRYDVMWGAIRGGFIRKITIAIDLNL